VPLPQKTHLGRGKDNGASVNSASSCLTTVYFLGQHQQLLEIKEGDLTPPDNFAGISVRSFSVSFPARSRPAWSQRPPMTMEVPAMSNFQLITSDLHRTGTPSTSTGKTVTPISLMHRFYIVLTNFFFSFARYRRPYYRHTCCVSGVFRFVPPCE